MKDESAEIFFHFFHSTHTFLFLFSFLFCIGFITYQLQTYLFLCKHNKYSAVCSQCFFTPVTASLTTKLRAKCSMWKVERRTIQPFPFHAYVFFFLSPPPPPFWYQVYRYVTSSNCVYFCACIITVQFLHIVSLHHAAIGSLTTKPACK